MVQDNYGCSLTAPTPGGGRVDVALVDVEGQCLGLSLTEHRGLEMRRVGAELQNTDDIRALRDSLNSYLARHGG